MGKRPSIVDKLDLDPAPSAQVAAPSAEVLDLKTAAKKAAKSRDVQHTSIYIPRAAYERLREIAFHERRKIHDLIMEGVDSVIAERGHTERTSSKTKAS